jgi:DNA-binding MarR family transcriptional regulator
MTPGDGPRDTELVAPSGTGSADPLLSSGPPAAEEPHRCYAEIASELGRQGRLMHLLKTQMSNAPAGLDWAAFGLLTVLITCGPRRQGELADTTMLDPSTVSRHTSQLVKAGLVSRRPDPVDGRAAQLIATSSGEALGAELIAHRRRLLAGLLVDWTDQDAHRLLHLLRRLNDGMERKVADGPDPGRRRPSPRPPIDLTADVHPGHATVTRPPFRQHPQES